MGLLLSLVCLLLCILTFLLVKSIQSSRTMVHLHLCISLFLGSIIFLVGVENEGGKVRSCLDLTRAWSQVLGVKVAWYRLGAQGGTGT